MIKGCLETFDAKEKAKEKARLDRKSKLDQDLLALDEGERAGAKGAALRSACDADLEELPEPTRIPPYLVEALWWMWVFPDPNCKTKS